MNLKILSSVVPMWRGVNYRLPDADGVGMRVSRCRHLNEK
jgi:hypothetical protein